MEKLRLFSCVNRKVTTRKSRVCLSCQSIEGQLANESTDYVTQYATNVHDDAEEEDGESDGELSEVEDFDSDGEEGAAGKMDDL